MLECIPSLWAGLKRFNDFLLFWVFWLYCSTFTAKWNARGMFHAVFVVCQLKWENVQIHSTHKRLSRTLVNECGSYLNLNFPRFLSNTCQVSHVQCCSNFCWKFCYFSMFWAFYLVFFVYVLTGCRGMWDNISCWHHADIGEVVVNTCPAALKSLFTKDGNSYFNICKLSFIHHNMILRSKIGWYQ